jgi:hypothetical protein
MNVLIMAHFFFLCAGQPVAYIFFYVRLDVSENISLSIQLVYWLFWYYLEHAVWTHTLGCLIIFVNLLILEYESSEEK